MSASVLIFTGRRRGPQRLPNASSTKLKKGAENNRNSSTESSATTVVGADNNNGDDEGSNAQEFRRKPISTKFNTPFIKAVETTGDDFRNEGSSVFTNTEVAVSCPLIDTEGGGEGYYHYHNIQREEYDGGEPNNKTFRQNGDGDDDRSQKKKGQQSQKFVGGNETSETSIAPRASRVNNHNNERFQVSCQEQRHATELLEQFQHQLENENGEVTADRKTILWFQPLLLNKNSTANNDAKRTKNYNNRICQHLQVHRTVDKRWRTTSAGGGRGSDSLPPSLTNNVPNNIINNGITSSPIKGYFTNANGIKPNQNGSNLCDKAVNMLISLSEILFKSILCHLLFLRDVRRKSVRDNSGNVFTSLFNLLLVLFCILQCLSSCHQVNCLEDSGATQQLVQDTVKSSSSLAIDANEKKGTGMSNRLKGENSGGSDSAVFGVPSLSSEKETVKQSRDGWLSLTETTVTEEIPSRSHSTSAFDLFHRAHVLDKRSSVRDSAGRDAAAPAANNSKNDSTTRRVNDNNDDENGGVNSNGPAILSRDKNKSIQSLATSDSFNNAGDGDEGATSSDHQLWSNNSQSGDIIVLSSSSGSKSHENKNNSEIGDFSSDKKQRTSVPFAGGSHPPLAGNEPSPLERMSADSPTTRDRFLKNMSTSSIPNKRGSRSVCRLSEFVCKGGKCISADKFCDGVDDCGDGSPSSDEPRFCTPCNRTYYGELGSTYQISLSSETIAAALGLNQQLDVSQGQTGSGGHGGPAQFVCHLTFFAAGDNFGDLVQLMFDSVNIGQFVSSVMDGCPEGSLQVAEISRPITGGQWCGSGAGFSVYFSEMSTITLTLIVGGPSLSHSSSKSALQNGSQVTRPIDAFPGSPRSGPIPGGQSQPIMPPPPPPEFDFKMRYKFIPQYLAAVRYGVLGSPIERGQLEPGTYCNRILEQCHRRRCKIQSPNYPGLYPRNVSCFFTVRQRDKPQCKRVLVQVSQSRSHKVQLRSLLPVASGLVMSPVSANDPTASMAVDTFMTWDECNWTRDKIVIYDGNSIDAPVLLSICGGSHIPPVTSSGPEIHIAFHSTPFGNPLGPLPPPPFPAPLRGFELDVDVVLVDSETADYTNAFNCTFYFVSSKSGAKGHRGFKLQQDGGNWITGVTGAVSSPRHTLPPNTTCRYEFKGTDSEAIWIYFVSYRRDYVKDAKRLPEGNCTTLLTIRDGLLGHGQPRALLGSFCDSDLPKLCEHKALQNETRMVRACTKNESYISAGASLIIEQQFLEGTALRPLHYKFHYEFVSRHPSGTESSCSRHFHMSKMKSKKGTIRTTDNIFDFGRGGRRNLTCTYTFTMGAHDGLKLSVLRSSFGDRPCRTMVDLETGRYTCNYFVPPVPTTKSPSGASGQNDTFGALSNLTYSTPHPFFAADHPGGNYTGAGGNREGVSTATNSHNFPRSDLTLEEYIWPAVNISSHKNCICSNSSRSSGYTFTFLGRKILLTFAVENMKGQDGYENFFVEMEYEVLKGEGCRGDNHYMKTESGLISLESYFNYGPRDNPPTCDHYPWLLEAKENHSLYLRIPGFAMLEEKTTAGQQKAPKAQGLTVLHNLTAAVLGLTQHQEEQQSSPDRLMLPYTATSLVTNSSSTSSSNKPSSGSAIFQLDRICPTTKNRIFVYDRDNRLIQKICPSSNHQMSKKNVQVVELYSGEFYQFTSPLYPPPRPRFIIEFVGRELGTYRINWLEVMSARMKTALKAMQTDFIGRATIAGRGLGANYSDVYKKELQKITSSWDETLTAMFEGQNGVGHGPPSTGGDSVHLVDERPPAPPPVCTSYCPELRACISEKLWCDGEIHCPITKMDEISCDSFWLTLGQLMSPAVYIPLLAAIVSAISCCLIVLLAVSVKKLVLSSRFKRHHHHQHHHHRPGSMDGRSSMGSSCTSTVDRRTLPPRDWTLDHHDPLS